MVGGACMKQLLYGESVKGATHVRNGAPLQDSYKIEKVSDCLLYTSDAADEL